MADLETLRRNLEAEGFETSYFETAQAAADYLDGRIDGTTVGFGGSVSVQQLGIYPRLAAHNQTVWHWEGGELSQAALTKVYLTSVNGLAETGELINIDGTGNRVASTLYGHEEVYFVVGINKIAPDYDAALWRARNIAAPKNAQRLHRETPCAAKGDKCYNCRSPQRICRALTVHWCKPGSIQRAEVVIVGEPLGY